MKLFKKAKLIFHIRRIQGLLLFSNILLIAFIVLSFFVVFSFYIDDIFTYTAKNVTQQMAESISSQLDSLISQTDNAAKQVIFSDNIIENLLDPNEGAGLFLELSRRREISNELNAIIGSSYPFITQINLIDCAKGNYIVCGQHSLETLISLSELSDTDFIQEAIANNGVLTVSALHIDKWGSSSENQIVSVLRSFTNRRNHETGIVEIPITIQRIEEIFVNTVAGSAFVERMVLIDDDGNIILSKNCTDEEALACLASLQSDSDYSEDISNQVLCYADLETTAWHVFLVADKQQIISPISQFRQNILIFLLCSFPFGILLAYFLSKRFTKPIDEIHHSIQNMSQSIHNFVPQQIDLEQNELVQLNLTFQSLCSQLDASIQETISARNYEIESHMEALRSKMNPHFLYNTLALIQSMAESGSCADIVGVCDDLSTILRYILSKDNSAPTLRTEFVNAAAYLNMMFRRFHNKLSYDISLAPELSDVEVPKLIIQPLIENSFKHAFINEQPWVLNIFGESRSDGGWCITIEDNGVGFSDEFLNDFALFCKAFNTHDAIHATAKIGIRNIYMRMKIKYGDAAIFELSNSNLGGAKVKIGVRGGL